MSDIANVFLHLNCVVQLWCIFKKGKWNQEQIVSFMIAVVYKFKCLTQSDVICDNDDCKYNLNLVLCAE